MANAQTTHFGLSQWAPEDPVLRTDFNQNLAAIDRALHEIREACPIWKLGSARTDVNTDKLVLDLSGWDMSQFQELHILVHGTATDGNRSLYLSINDEDEACNGNYTGASAGWSGSGGGRAVQIADYCGSGMCARGWITEGEGYLSYNGFAARPGKAEQDVGAWNLSMGDIRFLRLDAGTTYQLSAGSKITVYGLRK